MINKEVSARLGVLLDRLIKGAKDEYINWEPIYRHDSADMVGFSADSTSFTIRSKDNDRSPPFIFQMHDSRGMLAMEVDTGDPECPSELQDKFERLWESIYSNPKRLARLLDKAIRDIDSIPPF